MYDKVTLSKIMEVLGDEKRIMEELATLEERKCNLLAESSFVNLDVIDEQIAELVHQLNALEKERMYTTNQMAQSADMDTLKDLINAVPEEDKIALIQIQHGINAVIQRLNFLKSVTQQLLQDKMDMINVTLNEASGDANSVEYTEKGQTKSKTSKSNPILFNKSV